MNPKLIAASVLIIVILIVGWLLHRRDADDKSKLNLEDLLLGEDGRLSKAAAVMMGAFALTTWLMAYLALTGKMTEGYLAIYVGAWIAPTVTTLIKRPGDVPTVQPLVKP